jgi:hypothetical protein
MRNARKKQKTSKEEGKYDTKILFPLRITIFSLRGNKFFPKEETNFNYKTKSTP